MNVLETERLVLRPLGEGDLDALLAVVSDPEGLRLLGRQKPRTREETAERLRRVAAHWQEHGFGLWTLLDKEGGGFVGWCGVGYLRGPGDAELTYGLAEAYRGRGLATEAVRRVLRHAFEVLHLPRVVGVALSENLPSQRVMARAGMAFRGDIACDGKAARLYVIENPGGGGPG
jgi:RimJ/RimL family protein N-acetyltransferase